MLRGSGRLVLRGVLGNVICSVLCNTVCLAWAAATAEAVVPTTDPPATPLCSYGPHSLYLFLSIILSFLCLPLSDSSSLFHSSRSLAPSLHPQDVAVGWLENAWHRTGNPSPCQGMALPRMRLLTHTHKHTPFHFTLLSLISLLSTLHRYIHTLEFSFFFLFQLTNSISHLPLLSSFLHLSLPFKPTPPPLPPHLTPTSHSSSSSRSSHPPVAVTPLLLLWIVLIVILLS